MRALLLALVIACGGGSAESPPPGGRVEIALDQGTAAELTASRTRLTEALASRPDDGELVAQLAYVDGIAALLHGTPVPEDRVFARVAPGAPGFRAWALGKVAFELTRANKPEQLTELAAILADVPEDPWRRWLEARIALLRGDRVAAASILKGLSLPAARVDHALMLADEGKLAEADKVLDGLDSFPLAALTRGLVQFEDHQLQTAVKLVTDLRSEAPRMVAYHYMLDAQWQLVVVGPISTLPDLLGKLGKMRNLPNECSFWARIAWLHLQLGRSVDKTNDHKIAGITRQRCAALGKATGENHLLATVDAHLQLGLGRPEAAYDIAAKIPTPWGRVVRAYAALELGKPAEVPPLFPDIANQDDPLAPDHVAANIVVLQAKAQLATGKARDEALAELRKRADRPGIQRARYALGATYFAIGDHAAAQRELRRVVEQTSPEHPDPFAYRTHQLLAEIAIAADDLQAAGPEIDRAIAIHPGNMASRVIQARIQLRRGDPERALEAMAPARKLGELSATGKLVVAEALTSVVGATADHREQARALVLEVVGKLPPAEVGRVAALVDPKLPAQLKLPVGKLPKQKT